MVSPKKLRLGFVALATTLGLVGCARTGMTPPQPPGAPPTNPSTTSQVKVVVSGDFKYANPPATKNPRGVYFTGEPAVGDHCDGSTTPTPTLTPAMRKMLSNFTQRNKVKIHVCSEDGTIVGYVSEQGRYFVTDRTKVIDLGPDVLQQRNGSPTPDPFKGAVLFMNLDGKIGIATADGVGNVYTIGKVPKGIDHRSSSRNLSTTGLVVKVDPATGTAGVVLIEQTTGRVVSAADLNDRGSVEATNDLMKAIAGANDQPLDNSLALSFGP